MLLRNEKITLAEKIKLHKGELKTLHKTHKPTIKDKRRANKLLTDLVNKLYDSEIATERQLPNVDKDY